MELKSKHYVGAQCMLEFSFYAFVWLPCVAIGISSMFNVGSVNADSCTEQAFVGRCILVLMLRRLMFLGGFPT